jgi:sec-independent protein translocase protein TatA
MQFSFWHIVVVVLLIVLLFGRNKVSDLMGDVAVGIKNFKKGLLDDGKKPKRKKAGKDD